MRAKLADPALGKGWRVLASDSHQTIVASIGEGPQKNGIDEDIDHGVGADAESEREHRGDGEPGRAAHLAHCKAKVLQEAFDGRQRGAIAKRLACLLCAAEAKYRLTMCFFLA